MCGDRRARAPARATASPRHRPQARRLRRRPRPRKPCAPTARGRRARVTRHAARLQHGPHLGLIHRRPRRRLGRLGAPEPRHDSASARFNARPRPARPRRWSAPHATAHPPRRPRPAHDRGPRAARRGRVRPSRVAHETSRPRSSRARRAGTPQSPHDLGVGDALEHHRGAAAADAFAAVGAAPLGKHLVPGAGGVDAYGLRRQRRHTAKAHHELPRVVGRRAAAEATGTALGEHEVDARLAAPRAHPRPRCAA